MLTAVRFYWKLTWFGITGDYALWRGKRNSTTVTGVSVTSGPGVGCTLLACARISTDLRGGAIRASCGAGGGDSGYWVRGSIIFLHPQFSQNVFKKILSRFTRKGLLIKETLYTLWLINTNQMTGYIYIFWFIISIFSAATMLSLSDSSDLTRMKFCRT